MARKPTILTLSEFLKLKSKQRKPVIVYFDERQWANLTRGLKPTGQKPPRNNTLTFRQMGSGMHIDL
jgi:protein associated with RNAse G/E